MENPNGLYIGRGSREVVFESAVAKESAEFYLVSYPAHADYPTAIARKGEANETRIVGRWSLSLHAKETGCVKTREFSFRLD